MGRMGCAPGMVRASSLLGNEDCALNIQPRPNMTVDADPSTGSKCHPSSDQIDASTASAERGRSENDGSMLTLSTLLSQNGLPDLPQSLVEPHRNRAGVWRIKFSYEAGEPLSMDVVQATTMVSHLRELGEIELADEVTSAITSAKRYATM
jgi:hypothetical protein